MSHRPRLPALLNQFADLLDYPGPGLAERARACADLVTRLGLAAAPEASGNRAPAALLSAFALEAERMRLGEQQEAYASTFDLGRAYPYVGYHLFGETYRRSLFLLQLKARYAACGVDPARELPDHLVPFLRYLARCKDEEEFRELVQYALLPALDKVLGAGQARDREDRSALPLYLAVLQALYAVLTKAVGEPILPADWEAHPAEPVLAGDET